MDTRRKIIYISSDSNKTGGPVHLLHLVLGLKDDFDIEVVTSSGWLSENLHTAGIKTHELSVGLKNFFKLRSIIHENKKAIVHCQGVKAGLVGRLACLGLNNKVLYTEHNWTKDYKLKQKWRIPIQLFILGQLSKITDKIICVSGAVKNFYINKGLARENQLQVIYNGVKFLDFEKELSNEFVIGSVGSLVKRKGFETILKAFGELKIDNLQLRIVGEGELDGELKQLAINLGIKDKIDWLPADYDLSKFWPTIDLYVQASHDESFGMAIAEAIGNGIPTIASDVGAVPELITDPELLFNAGDSSMLFEKIKMIYDHYDKYFDKFSSQKQFFRDKFGVDRMVAESRKLYNEI